MNSAQSGITTPVQLYERDHDAPPSMHDWDRSMSSQAQSETPPVLANSHCNSRYRKQRFGSKLTSGAEPLLGPSAAKSATTKSSEAPEAPINYSDLRSRLVAELAKGEYDCAICYSTITLKAAVWSCHQCHTILHLSCVKQWATSSVKAAEEQNAMQEDIRIRERKGTWRCSGCQLARQEIPTVYFCWDGQVQDPKPSRNKKIPPHSCGKTCTKAKCPHGCSAGVCHPGPCPACPVTLQHRCFCGRKEVAVRCSQLAKSQTQTTPALTSGGAVEPVNLNEASSRQNGISCGETCEQLLNCRRHRCMSTCHFGQCNPCQEIVENKCYCGRNVQKMQCGQGSKQLCTTKEDVWEGFWQCQDSCQRKFDCGVHTCSRMCHPPSPSPSPCPFSPEAVSTCPCGAESRAGRRSCRDPIETCHRVCGKPFPCGHSCRQTCHLGECPPCRVQVSAPCRCGESQPILSCFERSRNCHEGHQEAALCDRLCRALRHCGKHECKRRCCPLAFQAKTTHGRKAASRNRPPTATELDEQDPARLHSCNMQCGRALSCGKEGHVCSLNCHRGPCPPCLRSCFEEVFCHCSRTVLEPPVPCGQRPVCRFPCARPPPSCGHSKMPHDCHEDGSCPPCVYLTAKRCDCGLNMVLNVPCNRQKVSCGSICGALKPCGFHRCTATCHSGAPAMCGECTAVCGKPKSICGHACKARCHAPARCDESRPCGEMITISCPCGHLRQSAICGVSSTTKTAEQRIKCNDACLVAHRNAQLAEALGLDRDDRRVAIATTSAPAYDQEMLLFYGMNHRFASNLEQCLSEFIRSPRHSIILPSASRSQRKFTHELAQAFGLASESMDAEPKRSVKISRTNQARIPHIMPSEMYSRAKQDIESGLANSKLATTGPRFTSLRPNCVAVATATPFNALLIEGVFGLDEGKIRSLLTESRGFSAGNGVPAAMSTAPLRLVSFTLKRVGEETVLVLPGDLTSTTIESLVAGKHNVQRLLKMNGIARSVVACSVDPATMGLSGMPRVLRREDRPLRGLSISTATSGRSAPVAWGGGSGSSTVAGGARLSGWAAVASGKATSSSTPMVPMYSAGALAHKEESSPFLLANQGLTSLSGDSARDANDEAGRVGATLPGQQSREKTSESWDDQ